MSARARSCLSADETLSFIEGALPVEERVSAERHVAQCETCRRWVAELVKAAEPAETLPATGDPLIGTFVGRYQLMRPMGSGASGLVYRARDPSLQRDVAMKLVREPEDVELRRRMLREARALAKVVHPSVVSVFDVGQADDDLFIAMELIDEGTLRRWLELSRPWSEVVTVFVGVASGLAAIHRSGLLHRDIKPDNILVSDGGRRALITDLGLTGAAASDSVFATVPQTSESSMVTRGAVGTPGYIAPEVVDGGRATVHSDQFSFGVTLFEALTRRRASASLPEIRRQLAQAGVPEAVTLVVVRCIEQDPARRYGSMVDVEAALEAARHPRRRRWPLWTAGVALTAGVGAWVGMETPASECDGIEARVASVWGERDRATVRESLEATGNGDLFDDVAAGLDEEVEGWIRLRRQLCNTGEPSSSMSFQRVECLEDQLQRVDAVVEVLSRAVVEDRAEILDALAYIDPEKNCMGEHIILRPPARPETVVAVRRLRGEMGTAGAEIMVGETTAALRRLSAIRVDVEAIEDIALRADLEYTEGTAFAHRGEHDAARRRFEAAVEAAEVSGHDRTRALALSALVTSPALSYEDAVMYGERARRVVKRVHVRGAFSAEIELFIADLHYRHGHYDEARSAATAALTELEQNGESETPQHLDKLSATFAKLSATELDASVSLVHAERALELSERANPQQPTLSRVGALVTLADAARRGGDYDRAVNALLEAREIYGVAFSEGNPAYLATLSTNLCAALTDRLVTFADGAPSLDSRDGQLAQAACQEALDIAREHALPSRTEAQCEAMSGALAIETFHYVAARDHYTRALSLFDAANIEDKYTLAAYRAGLAWALAYLDEEPRRALELATVSRPAYAEEFGPEETAKLDLVIERLKTAIAKEERRRRRRGGTR